MDGLVDSWQNHVVKSIHTTIGDLDSFIQSRERSLFNNRRIRPILAEMTT